MSHHDEQEEQGGTPHTLIPIAQGIHADILLDTHSLPSHSSGDTHPTSLAQLARRAAHARVFKVVIAPKGGVSAARRPHDVVREVRVLRRAKHDNIVPLLAYTFSPTRTEYTLTLPLLSATLAEVLCSLPPLTVIDIESQASRTTSRLELFAHVAQGLFSALEYLHARGIAHRDVKPANIMFAWDKRPVFIDFGTAWDGDGDGDGGGEMSFAVGTGPYRAPELLFSPAHYAAPALDLWASGAVLAELFRPHETDTDSDASSDTQSDDSSPSPPPDIPNPLEDDDHTRRGPVPLFDASFGEIGLAASIFRRLGTPTSETWPSFDDLPDAGKMLFDTRTPRGLGPALCLDALDSGAAETVLAMLEGLVRLEPAARVSAREVLGMLEALPRGDVEQTIGLVIWSASRRYGI